MANQPKTALVLAGGGTVGGAYELGALTALESWLQSATVNDFDMYLGTSVGALLGGALAAGIPCAELAGQMERACASDGELGPGKMFAANLKGLLQRSQQLGGLALSRTSYYLRNLRRFCSLDLAWELLEGLPGGIYSASGLEKFIARVLAERGVATFADLKRELYVIATDLDTGERAVFGAGSLAEAPVARAIAASCAVPMVFEPVAINGRSYVDGMLHGIANLDIAIERGARLIVCVNPLTPLNNRRHLLGGSLGQAGMQAVGNQAMRTLFCAALHQQIQQLRISRPEVEIVLIEPAPEDVQVFATPLLGSISPRALAEHACATVGAAIERNLASYSAILAPHGFALARPAPDPGPAPERQRRPWRAKLQELKLPV